MSDGGADSGDVSGDVPGDHTPARLGAEVTGDGCRFTVHSGVAERIELCLFDADGPESDRVDLVPGDDGTWHVDVSAVGHGQRYGFRVHGPGDPASGHACDPAKLLVDPAARRVVGDLVWNAELVTPGVDSAPYVPRSVVVAPGPPVAAADRPRTEWADTVVYEAHVGHLTARHGLVPVDHRGRYAGLAADPVLDHLQRLGVTAVELLPVQHFVSESFLSEDGRRNVWGYNPLAWGAPHAGYASAGGDPVSELRAAVRRFHDVGIEVWLDVVYNHTCEGSLGSGPILSWRGFDNAATYRLLPGEGSLVDDDVTGCGNAIDARSPWIRRLIIETLVRWVEEFGVDGFRFDLASTLIRGDDGPTADHPWLAEVAARPELAEVKLVAEPWDTGMGGYALGRFPEPWREWNDRFRDDVRDLVRAHATWPAAASALTASASTFGGREPTATLNAVAFHDGFTVRDLVSYDSPVDGGHGQRSWNGGIEGPTADAGVLAHRRRRQRMLLGLTLLAQGVPQLSSGDEIGRTQGGRADGYTLEPDQWGLPWQDADWDLAAWAAAAAALRRECSVLRRNEWVPPHDPRIQWFDGAGEPMDDEAWNGSPAAPAADGGRSGGDEAVDGRGDEVAGPDDSHPEWPPALQVLFRPDPNLGERGPAVLLVVVAGEGERQVALPSGEWQVRLDAQRPRGGTGIRAGAVTVTGPTLLALTGV